ncbi:MAG: hypothetical protein ACYTBJ_02425 [Planctomycetota bacterium]
MDYYMSLDDEGEVSRGPNLEANLKNYQLYQALLQGGDAVLWPPSGTRHPISGAALEGSYLTRLKGESDVKMDDGQVWHPYTERINQSAHVPVAGQIIDVYVNTLFRQEIDRTEVRTAVGDDFFNDVDLHGHNAEDFLSMVYTMGLTNGWVGVLTDSPKLDPGEVPSREHELAMGRRPYSRILLPTRIWDYTLDPVTNVFTTALVQETRHTWRIWTPDQWVLIDKEKHVLDQGEHDHGKVPIDLFIAQYPTSEVRHPPLGVSAINSTALMQLQLDQHQSLGDELQRKTNFPFVHIRLDPEEIRGVPGQVKNAPGWWQFFEADLDWKAPPDTCLRQNREHIADLESKIYKAQGVHRRSQDSVEAHSGLALDYENSPIYATVQAWSRRLRTFENRYWQTVAEQMGVSLDQDSVKYPDDFSVRPVDHEISQAKSIVDAYGSWADTPEAAKRYVNIKIATAAQRDKGHLKDVDELIDDLKSADVETEEEELTEPNPNGDAEAEEVEEPTGSDGEKIEESNAVDPTTALNGAQVTSMIEIVDKVARKEFPRETGVAMIVAAFPLDAAQANAVMGPVGTTFFADKPSPLDFGEPEQEPPEQGDADGDEEME